MSNLFCDIYYVNEKNRLRFSDQHYFKKNSEMSDLFADIPEALENNYNLPFRCNFRPVSSNPVLPNISSEKGGNADEILTKESEEGLKNKFFKVFNKIFLFMIRLFMRRYIMHLCIYAGIS